jgi:hypothetical protein
MKDISLFTKYLVFSESRNAPRTEIPTVQEFLPSPLGNASMNEEFDAQLLIRNSNITDTESLIISI